MLLPFRVQRAAYDGLATSESHFLVDLDIYSCINSVDSWIEIFKILGMGKHSKTTASSQKTFTVYTNNFMEEKSPTQSESIFH